jgi:hypothetical protein
MLLGSMLAFSLNSFGRLKNNKKNKGALITGVIVSSTILGVLMFMAIQYLPKYGDAGINDAWLSQTYVNRELDLNVFLLEDSIKLEDKGVEFETDIIVEDDLSSFKYMSNNNQVIEVTYLEEGNQIVFHNTITKEDIICDVWYKW